jgi:hypothetical protein
MQQLLQEVASAAQEQQHDAAASCGFAVVVSVALQLLILMWSLFKGDTPFLKPTISAFRSSSFILFA